MAITATWLVGNEVILRSIGLCMSRESFNNLSRREIFIQKIWTNTQTIFLRIFECGIFNDWLIEIINTVQTMRMFVLGNFIWNTYTLRLCAENIGSHFVLRFFVYFINFETAVLILSLWKVILFLTCLLKKREKRAL